MSFLMRVVLPDRPGTLGAVATELGKVHADICSLDVIHRGAGWAVDDLVLEVPSSTLADALISAAETIEGVKVESVRPYAGQIDPHRELALLDSLADRPKESFAALAEGVAPVFRAGWALVLAEPVDQVAKVLAAGSSAPEVETLKVPWWPAKPTRSLAPDAEWAPPDWERLGIELAVAPLGEGALLVGRQAVQWLPSELLRLEHLARIAASVTAAAGGGAG